LCIKTSQTFSSELVFLQAKKRAKRHIFDADFGSKRDHASNPALSANASNEGPPRRVFCFLKKPESLLSRLFQKTKKAKRLHLMLTLGVSGITLVIPLIF
jgi:hypothetical protein